jgi:cell division septal protein FtsQ
LVINLSILLLALLLKIHRNRSAPALNMILIKTSIVRRRVYLVWAVFVLLWLVDLLDTITTILSLARLAVIAVTSNLIYTNLFLYTSYL